MSNKAPALDLRSILHKALPRSKALLLVLTARVLERPWVLMEVFQATRCKLPVLCIHVVNGGYSFPAAQAYLSDLETQLGARCPHREAQPRRDRRVRSGRQLQPDIARQITHRSRRQQRPFRVQRRAPGAGRRQARE